MSHKMLIEFVSTDAIATCVARHTGIPVSHLTGSESKKLLDIENKLSKVGVNKFSHLDFCYLHTWQFD